MVLGPHPLRIRSASAPHPRRPRDAEQGVLVAAAQRDAAVRRFTEGKELRKVVYVPNRLLNLVLS